MKILRIIAVISVTGISVSLGGTPIHKKRSSSAKNLGQLMVFLEKNDCCFLQEDQLSVLTQKLQKIVTRTQQKNLSAQEVLVVNEAQKFANYLFVVEQWINEDIRNCPTSRNQKIKESFLGSIWQEYSRCELQ
ncbi:MAG: hypothetical protein WD068_03575 [Candidatus Babeliales bacterium]